MLLDFIFWSFFFKIKLYNILTYCIKNIPYNVCISKMIYFYSFIIILVINNILKNIIFLTNN